MHSTAATDHGIPFRDALHVWTRIALLSFGGPAGQIAVMHRILVDEKKWIGEERFLHALNFCMLLPGPEAQQLAIYIGWLLHRVKGGLVAGLLFVLPGMIAIMALSWLYVLVGQAAPVAALFFGLKAAVVAIVFQAVVRIGARALGHPAKIAIAAAAFLALFLLRVPFPMVILTAGLIGWFAGRAGLPAFAGGGHGHAKPGSLRDEDSALGTEIPDHARRRWRSMALVPLALLAAWLLPVALVVALAPADSAFATIATFFSKLAMLTFGGAYAVLAWVSQAAVDQYHWLSPAEMLDGLGLAESTPGPLIMVTQYVGFLGAYRHPDGLPPLLAGTLGGLLTTWVTFVPCFLWIFAGAPFVERLRSNRALAAALAAITAAVVGVILNLALWFALHYWFGALDEATAGPIRLPLPDIATIDWAALLLSAAALIAIFRFRLGIFTLLGGCALAGLLIRLV
ncbi:chromate efflux transporter [Rhizorhabdus dicambivorans]|uniref:Chromate transporter n=1 Tax=Rhizorhabdus dicambivorans TaxID=1850238 RepID=A0A2A4G098_9SPHN|nr:chromate transporter [Rhizorhabdus dicambivorans]ATE63013.1 chromate transporter [Rhizorhabdus dicambivorans]PCE43189.1 chromate transporter [Rhizorhabdus dicambivorans]